MRLTTTLNLTGSLTEWTAEEGEKPKQLVYRGDGVKLEVIAPPKGSHIPNPIRITLEEAAE